MRTSDRRSLDSLFIVGGVLATGAAALIGGLLSQAEEVRQLWAHAELLADGSAEVHEVIDYDFGVFATEKHGIFRIVPGLDPGDPIEVSSPDAPDQILVTTEGDGSRIRIGDPNTTVGGEHRYEITYRLDGIVSGDRLAWDAVGTNWQVPIARAEIHVVADRRFEDVVCQRGRTGSTNRCEIEQPEPGHLTAIVTGIASGMGVTVRATLGAPVASAPAVSPPPPLDEEDANVLVLAFFGAGGAALAGGLIASKLIRRAGREQVWPGGATDAAYGGGEGIPDGAGRKPMRVDVTDLQELTTIEVAPPPELHPSEGGVLLAEAVKNEHKVAWLIDVASSGLIDLKNNTLVRRPIPADTDPETLSIIETAFAGRERLTLGRYDPTFTRAWRLVGNKLERWRATSGLWDAAADRRATTIRGSGIVGAIVGLLGAFGTALLVDDAFYGASRAWLIGTALFGALAGISLAAAVRGWELRVRTPQGTALWLRVESFRRFLAQSEAAHAEEAAKRGVLREYTAWAVATGEIDRWSTAAAAAVIPPVALSGLVWVFAGPSLVHSISSMSTAPSSSGGGSGGGGGGVGGGDGGGGGGSW